MNTATKTCQKCKQTKPRSAFLPEVEVMDDASRFWCLSCLGKEGKGYVLVGHKKESESDK